MKLIAFSLSIALVIGQMIRLPIGEQGIQVIDAVSAAVLFQILFFLFLRLAGRYAAPLPLFSAFSIFSLWCITCLMHGIVNLLFGNIELSEFLNGVLAAIRFLFPILIVGYIVSSKPQRLDLKGSMRAMYTVGYLVVAFGVLQSLFIHNFALRYGPDYEWDYQGNRLVSIFLDPNLAASFTSGFVLLGFVILRLSVFPRRIVLMGIVLAVASTLLTLSRGGIIGLLFGSLTYWLFNKGAFSVFRLRNIFLLLSSAIFGPLLVYYTFDLEFLINSDRFGATNESALIRFNNYSALLEIFTQHPFFGVGFNYTRALYSDSFAGFSGNYVDGGILVLLSSLGIVGFAVLFLALLKFKNIARLDIKLWGPFLGMFAIQSFATSTIFYPLIVCYFAAVLSFAQMYTSSSRN